MYILCVINKFYMDKTEGESVSIPLFLRYLWSFAFIGNENEVRKKILVNGDVAI